MNMNRKILSFLIIIVLLFLTFINVNAEEKRCNLWLNNCGTEEQCKQICESHSYQGYKCEYNPRLKAGARCKAGTELADEVKETITACDQIKDHDNCVNAKIVGHECKWIQNACYDNTMIDDGTGETIIANDKEDRENQENKNDENKNNQDDVKNDSITDPTIVGENFCGETSTKRVLSLVGNILIIVKIVVPLLIIIIGSIDLFKAVMGKDEKDLMKSVKSLGLRLLLGIFIFFVPTIVNYVIDLVGEISGGSSNNQCVTCVLNPSKCEVNK